jgi:hypothetical protein
MIKKGEKLRKSEKKSKLSPKEIEFKQFKKEFNKQANYFKFLKQVGNLGTKAFKLAKKDLKKGNVVKAKAAIAKYSVLSIEEWYKIVNK